MSVKQIKVSEPVHEELSELKETEGHTSFDSVIRGLLYEHREGE